MMVKPFEDAAFKMKTGDISDLVRSDFGFHIIRLTEIKPAAIKPLEEVKAEIASEIKKQLAAKKYAEAAEIFTNTAYEQADSLKPLADKLKLKIETATNLKRKADPNAPPGSPVNNPKFLAALFSTDALKNKHNTEAVEVAPSTLVVGHVVEYVPVSKLPFESVQTLVQARLTQTEAAALARKAGEARLAQLQKAADDAQFGAAKAVSRTKGAGIENVALATIMTADVSKLPAVVGIDVPGQGYNIYRINKVTAPATLDVARRQAERQQVASALAQEEMLAYIDVVKQRAKVKIKTPAQIDAATQAEEKAGGDPLVKPATPVTSAKGSAAPAAAK